MAAYSFSVPQEIVFGRGTLDKLPEYVKKLDCKKAFIIKRLDSLINAGMH